MKKFFVTILALIYLTVSSGATVHLHYCMGKLMSWGLSDKEAGKCGTCGMQKAGHKGCCHDEQKLVKSEKDQKKPEAAFQSLKISTDAIAFNYVELPLLYPSSTVLENPTAHAPPRLGTVPIFVLNCSFRI